MNISQGLAAINFTCLETVETQIWAASCLFEKIARDKQSPSQELPCQEGLVFWLSASDGSSSFRVGRSVGDTRRRRETP